MDAPPIDLVHLHQFCNGDRARMEQFIRMYISSAPGLFTELEHKARNGDATGLASVAHSLRPQVSFMGAQVLLDALAAIEQRALTEGTPACAELIARLPALNERVVAALRSALDPG